MPGLGFMVLHPARLIRGGAIDQFKLNGDRRGDVPHLVVLAFEFNIYHVMLPLVILSQ
jgi:hypothetical protein